MLVFTASEVETATLAAGINPGFAGLLGGMTGGIAQAYATMGERSFTSQILGFSDQLHGYVHSDNILCRLYDMYEDSGDHSPQDRCFRCQTSINIRSLHGNLPSRRYSWCQQRCECCRCSSVYQLGFSVDSYNFAAVRVCTYDLA